MSERQKEKTYAAISKDVGKVDHATLRADIDKGMADVAAGRLRSFDRGRIIARGRVLLASRTP